jgi:hypothetical protein
MYSSILYSTSIHFTFMKLIFTLRTCLGSMDLLPPALPTLGLLYMYNECCKSHKHPAHQHRRRKNPKIKQPGCTPPAVLGLQHLWQANRNLRPLQPHPNLVWMEGREPSSILHSHFITVTIRCRSGTRLLVIDPASPHLFALHQWRHLEPLL